MNLSEEQYSKIFTKITLPLSDSSKLYATTFEAFKEAVTLIENNAFLRGKAEGLQTAKDIVEESFNKK